MDKTLGSANVIDASNIERLVDEMRRSVALEAFEEAAKLVDAIRGKTNADLATMTEEITAADQLAKDLQNKLDDEMFRVRRVADAVLLGVNAKSQLRRKWAKAIGFLFLAGVEAIPLIIGSATGVTITLALWASTMFLHYIGTLEKRIFVPILSKIDRLSFERHLKDAGLQIDDLPYEIEYVDHAFVPLAGVAIAET